jgi:LmbE family N-acetylglucosaminyl deacetylase
MAKQLRLVAIFAHPDDEAFGTGGTLAKYAHEGVEVHLVMATLGQAGQIANPEVTLDQPMGVLRERELRRACQQYGIKELHLLGYMDGHTPIVSQSEAVYKIVQLLRELKPQVVISFGPEGIYGHYDHLAVHRWATAAVELAGDSERWPEAGSPHQVAKFYHRAMFEEQVAQLEEINGRKYVPIDGVPFPFLGYPSEKITTVVNVREYAQAKLEGIRSHVSQLSPANPYLQQTFDLSAHPWFWQEAFILAKHRPDIDLTGWSTEKEDDLFRGLR